MITVAIIDSFYGQMKQRNKVGQILVYLVTELLSKAVYTVIKFGIFKSCRNIFFSKD